LEGLNGKIKYGKVKVVQNNSIVWSAGPITLFMAEDRETDDDNDDVNLVNI